MFAALLPHRLPTRGARPLVQFLRDGGINLVIATSAGHDELRAVLERAGVADLFPERMSKDDAVASKPKPDIVRAALSKIDADTTSTLMVRDTPYDIEASTGVGIKAIALRCGGFWPDSALRGAQGILDDPAALLEHWQSNRKRDRR